MGLPRFLKKKDESLGDAEKGRNVPLPPQKPSTGNSTSPPPYNPGVPSPEPKKPGVPAVRSPPGMPSLKDRPEPPQAPRLPAPPAVGHEQKPLDVVPEPAAPPSIAEAIAQADVGLIETEPVPADPPQSLSEQETAKPLPDSAQNFAQASAQAPNTIPEPLATAEPEDKPLPIPSKPASIDKSRQAVEWTEKITGEGYNQDEESEFAKSVEEAHIPSEPEEKEIEPEAEEIETGPVPEEIPEETSDLTQEPVFDEPDAIANISPPAPGIHEMPKPDMKDTILTPKGELFVKGKHYKELYNSAQDMKKDMIKVSEQINKYSESMHVQDDHYNKFSDGLNQVQEKIMDIDKRLFEVN